MKNTNKAFTLIELLAVILILGIIALIAIPTVSGIIKEAKEEAAKRSAENYAKAAETAVMKKNLISSFNPTTCDVSKTTLSCDGYSPIEVDIKGDLPESGTITFKNNIVDTYSLTYSGNKTVTNGSSNPAVPSIICTFYGVEKDSSKYSAGDKYTCTVAPGKDYTFYVLNDTPKTAESVNLILEANIDLTTGEPIKTNDAPKGFVAWMSKNDWIAAGGEDLSHDGEACENFDICSKNTKGPITAMNALKKATDSWTNLTEMTVTGWNNDASETNVGTFATPYKVRARLPYKSEVNATGCGDYSPQSCPLWMVNHLEDEYNLYTGITKVNDILAYWILSADTSDYSYTFNVFNAGIVRSSAVNYDKYIGIRPVITVSKSKLS